MNNRERILKTFQKEKFDKIVWQPRIYYWYNGRFNEGTIPKKYQGKSMLDVYDDLGAVPRYPAEALGLFVFKMEIEDDKVQHHVKEKKESIIRVYETPIGSLREVIRKGTGGSGGYHTEYPVKRPEDMKIMKYILDHTKFIFDRRKGEYAEFLPGKL